MPSPNLLLSILANDTLAQLDPYKPLVTSPFDEQAIEAALRVRDKLSDTKITILTFGPKSAQSAIKRGLSMGADEGILVCDAGLESIDGYGTAYVLSEAIKKAGFVPIVVEEERI